MTFKRKLFISFLLIAFLPTSLLLVWSYNLATEGVDLLVARGISETLESADSLALIFANQLEEQLEIDIKRIDISSFEKLKTTIEDSLFSCIIEYSDTGDTVFYGVISEREKDYYYQIIQANSTNNSGRDIIEKKPFVWALQSDQNNLYFFVRFLPQGYFDLTNKVLQGHARYHSMSDSLLPGGKNLLLKLTIALIVISLILSLMTAQKLSYRLTHRLDKLVEGTERISRGDLRYRIPQAGSDEIGQLIGDFNQMTSMLESTTENLIKAEREMTWRETARTIAHEIKNLLTPVNIALYKIKQLLGGGEKQIELQHSVDSLTQEVEAISDLAKQFALFAHPPKLAKSEVEMEILAEDIAAIYSEYGEIYKIRIEINPKNLKIEADPDLLRRLISNLTKNSIEAMPQGGEITIKADGSEKNFIIEVFDNGPGAPVTDDLLEPYVTSKKAGTGLGLAIVKKICDSHGWELTLNNLDPGFAVRIKSNKV